MTLEPADLHLSPPSANNGRRTLLIVDDEAGPRQALQIVFQDQYDVLLAGNGKQAMELVEQNHVDAVVLDIRMSGLSGIEVLERIKKTDPAIEVVMLTAYETIGTTQQALRLGACDYLAKPFDLGTMRQAVAKAMDRRSVSEEMRANNGRLSQLKEEIKQYELRFDTLKTRSQIYASILHDINNPLLIIGGYISLIDSAIAKIKGLDEENAATIQSHLALISTQVRICTEIAQRYRLFLRERPSETAYIAVNPTLQMVAQLLAIHPSSRGHQVETRPLARDLSVKINGTEFIQILLNLAINGLQCSDQPHTVELAARLQSEALALTDFVDGPQDLFLNREGLSNVAPLLALSVTDNGPGIPPENLNRIFEAFFTTKPPEQGTGLGLSIVLRLTKEAHGAIQVHTQLDRGTVFTIYLRLQEEGAPAGPVKP